MRLTALLVFVLGASAVQADAQARQGGAPRTRPQPAVDPLTATIAGRVTTADTGGPVRGAEVRTISDGGVNRLAATDGDGRFELRDLPAGTFRIAVSKSGFVSLQFGQRRPSEGAMPIELSQGERFTANVALLRGGVIAGRVFDRFGEPVAGVRVQALRSRMVEGRRQLQPAGTGDETDDRGSFRVYGLAPADYYLVAQPPRTNDMAQRGQVPIYYPGTGDFSQAQRITVTAAAEASVLIQLAPVETASVSGVVLGPDGTPVGATVNLTSESVGLGYVNALPSALPGLQGAMPYMISTHAEGDGRFVLTDVPPGPYSLRAQSVVTEVSASGGITGPNLTAVPLSVTGDVAGLTITLGTGGSIGGTFVRDPGASGPLPRGLGVRVSGAGMSRVNTGPDNTFLMDVHGRVRLFVEGLPEGWTVKSIDANDMDVTDTPIDLTNGQEVTVRIVLTDRLTEVTGTVNARTAGGESVVVFADNPAKWTYPSRFVRSVRLDDRGGFSIKGLPPGERYLAAVVAFLEDGDTQDPEILERLRNGATGFTLAEGERRTVELRPAGR